MSNKTTEIKSDFSGAVYHVYNVSPVIYDMLVVNDDGGKSTPLRLQIANLAESIKSDKHYLELKSLNESERQFLQQRIDQSTQQITKLSIELMALNKPKPETAAKLLRTFVEECTNMSDIEILRMGYDVDLLYMHIQLLADKDSAKYAEMINFFREKRGAVSDASI